MKIVAYFEYYGKLIFLLFLINIFTISLILTYIYR